MQITILHQMRYKDLRPKNAVSHKLRFLVFSKSRQLFYLFNTLSFFILPKLWLQYLSTLTEVSVTQAVCMSISRCQDTPC